MTLRIPAVARIGQFKTTARSENHICRNALWIGQFKPAEAYCIYLECFFFLFFLFFCFFSPRCQAILSHCPLLATWIVADLLCDFGINCGYCSVVIIILVAIFAVLQFLSCLWFQFFVRVDVFDYSWSEDSAHCAGGVCFVESTCLKFYELSVFASDISRKWFIQISP